MLNALVRAQIRPPTVGSGLVASLARPGGNVTGLSMQSADLAGKRLALLREVVPGLRRVAIMANVDYPAAMQEMDLVSGRRPPLVRRSAHAARPQAGFHLHLDDFLDRRKALAVRPRPGAEVFPCDRRDALHSQCSDQYSRPDQINPGSGPLESWSPRLSPSGSPVCPSSRKRR